jgi:epoxide hydrolase 4
MIIRLKALGAAALLVASVAGAARAADIEDRVTHGYADSNGVKIHYATLGSGPLVVMIHGFPDYWYTWRQQMEGLSDRFQVVAIDQRGYNLSDKPAGVENYDVRLLVGDVVAVIKHLGQQKAIIVGHDWGGVVAWQLAINLPQMVERLVILNLPHPRGLSRELAEKALTADGLAGWVKDPDAKKKYVEAFGRSDFGAMLNYYKRNYPREPYTEDTSPVKKVQCSVLMIHGLGDTALLSPALNGTWDWIEKDLTLTTVPGAGHFVQADAADLVTKTMRAWLLR